jgi:hypothetical protein
VLDAAADQMLASVATDVLNALSDVQLAINLNLL